MVTAGHKLKGTPRHQRTVQVTAGAAEEVDGGKVVVIGEQPVYPKRPEVPNVVLVTMQQQMGVGSRGVGERRAVHQIRFASNAENFGRTRSSCGKEVWKTAWVNLATM